MWLGFCYRLMTRHGVADIVMSYQGREFISDVNNKLFELSGTEHRTSSAYHPQTNGLWERMNQTLTQSLIKLVNDNQDAWDLHIDCVFFAYRTNKNAGVSKTQGFQDPVLMQKHDGSFKATSSPSAHIHRTDQYQYHWVCSAADQKYVFLFDSKFHNALAKPLQSFTRENSP